jgi:hypothetical protein
MNLSITDKQHDHLDLDLLHLIQLEKETESNKGAQTIGVGRERGVRSHLVGRGRRGGRGLTQGMQCWLGDDGITYDAVERRAVAPGASDPGRGPRRRRWRSFPPLQYSLGSVRVCGVGCVRRRGEPRTASRGPHPLFIALCDGGPPTMDWLGAPDQGAVTTP